MEQPKYPKRIQKHIVQCPHCGADALDHMTKCPKCGGELTPNGYTPMIPEKTLKTIRTVMWIVLSLIALALIIWKLTSH